MTFTTSSPPSGSRLTYRVLTRIVLLAVVAATAFVWLSTGGNISKAYAAEAGCGSGQDTTWSPPDNLANGVKTSSDSRLWPSTAELYSVLKTRKNGAWFWSGRIDGNSVEDQAAYLAGYNGGATLEMMLARSGLTMPSWDPSNEASVKLWGDASYDFASQATGYTYVVQGKILRQGNIWESKECPTLMAEPGVAGIIAAYPSTWQAGKGTVEWADTYINQNYDPGGA